MFLIDCSTTWWILQGNDESRLIAHGTWTRVWHPPHTHTHTEHLLNKARQPWRPACLVFYIIIVIHNLVPICYSWDFRVWEHACMLLSMSLCVWHHVCPCMSVCECASWDLALHCGHVAWESENCAKVSHTKTSSTMLELSAPARPCMHCYSNCPRFCTQMHAPLPTWHKSTLEKQIKLSGSGGGLVL